jgi:hypothetical protein
LLPKHFVFGAFLSAGGFSFKAMMPWNRYRTSRILYLMLIYYENSSTLKFFLRLSPIFFGFCCKLARRSPKVSATCCVGEGRGGEAQRYPPAVILMCSVILRAGVFGEDGCAAGRTFEKGHN